MSPVSCRVDAIESRHLEVREQLERRGVEHHEPTVVGGHEPWARRRVFGCG